MKEVTVYTDGACSGNPGKGGYGAILIYGEYRKEISCGYKLTTNNRMELLACIRALELLKQPCKVTLYSDSRYVVDSVTKGWVYSWKKKNWMKKDGPAKNPDLWQMFLKLNAIHDIKFVWVKGHNENPGNERCDFLARKAASSDELSDDEGYLAD